MAATLSFGFIQFYSTHSFLSKVYFCNRIQRASTWPEVQSSKKNLKTSALVHDFKNVCFVDVDYSLNGFEITVLFIKAMQWNTTKRVKTKNKSRNIVTNIVKSNTLSSNARAEQFVKVRLDISILTPTQEVTLKKNKKKSKMNSEEVNSNKYHIWQKTM